MTTAATAEATATAAAVNILRIAKHQTDEFRALSFVIQARAKESNRYALSCVLIDDANIVATDGRRLFIANIAEFNQQATPNDDGSAFIHTRRLAPGLYDVMSSKASEIVLCPTFETLAFPPYADVVPKGDIQRATLHGDGHSMQSRIVATLGKANVLIDANFLPSKAFMGESWEVGISPARGPVRLVSGNLTAVIMPIHGDGVDEMLPVLLSDVERLERDWPLAIQANIEYDAAQVDDAYALNNNLDIARDTWTRSARRVNVDASDRRCYEHILTACGFSTDRIFAALAQWDASAEGARAQWDWVLDRAYQMDSVENSAPARADERIRWDAYTLNDELDRVRSMKIEYFSDVKYFWAIVSDCGFTDTDGELTRWHPAEWPLDTAADSIINEAHRLNECLDLIFAGKVDDADRFDIMYECGFKEERIHALALAPVAA